MPKKYKIKNLKINKKAFHYPKFGRFKSKLELNLKKSNSSDAKNFSSVSLSFFFALKVTLSVAQKRVLDRRLNI